jgi:hypothetical protein
LVSFAFVVLRSVITCSFDSRSVSLFVTFTFTLRCYVVVAFAFVDLLICCCYVVVVVVVRCVWFTFTFTFHVHVRFVRYVCYRSFVLRCCVVVVVCWLLRLLCRCSLDAFTFALRLFVTFVVGFGCSGR